MAVQSLVGLVVGGATLVRPEAGAVATAIGPSMAYGVNHLAMFVSRRRHVHAEETLTEAAAAVDVPIEQFIDQALSDDNRSELLVRALTAAQDVALREKRRAFGRALAAGVSGSSPIDDEFLFLRALADLDEPHIAVLQVLSKDVRPHELLPPGWHYNQILEQVPGVGNALRAILRTLELHTLITLNQQANELGTLTDSYRIGDYGRLMLSRLGEEAA